MLRARHQRIGRSSLAASARTHDAVAVTAKDSSEPLSHWTSASFELPVGIRWSSADAVRALAAGRPVVAASGVAAASGVTITVVLRPGQSPLAPCTERVLHALARIVAARAGRTPPATDTAPLSIAHAIAIERERLTRELTDHFAQHLETILGLLRDDAAHDPAERLHRATTGASRALVDLRERRTLWQQARRVDEAFALVESAIGGLARTAGIQLECTLAGRPQRVVADTVLEAASWITHAGLLNALEHAHATRARVAWSVTDDELAVSVSTTAAASTRSEPAVAACPRCAAAPRRSADRCRSSRWPGGARTCERIYGCRPAAWPASTSPRPRSSGPSVTANSRSCGCSPWVIATARSPRS